MSVSTRKVTASAVLLLWATACSPDESPSRPGGPSTSDETGAFDNAPMDGDGDFSNPGVITGAAGDGTPINPADGCVTGGTSATGDFEFSYIWVANAPESTISKINTRTMQEVGRYLTRADSDGNPSRTSVNLSGDVAVANRNGGVAKFYAQSEHCEDKNGDGSIQTSTGKDNVLAWDEEERRGFRGWLDRLVR